MNAQQRSWVFGVGFLVSGAVFLVVSAGQVVTVQYLPLAHRWTMHPPVGAIGMDWYFRALAAWGAGGLAAGIARIASRAAWTQRKGLARGVVGLGFAIWAWAFVYIVLVLVTTARGQQHEDVRRDRHAACQAATDVAG